MTHPPLKSPAPTLQPLPSDFNSTEDEIDLRHIYSALIRHKRLIACVAGGCLLLSTLFAFTRKPIWEGSFQIVLENESASGSGLLSQLSAQNPGLAGLVGLNSGGQGDQLLTEVKILESPSVLKPIFDYVKSSKSRAGEDVNNWRYASWLKGSLDIELEKGTSVLNISYRDTDQQLILPVLERISKEYQDYSGRDRERGISQAIAYLDEQIGVYKLDSLKSLRVAQEFAIEQDLTALTAAFESNKDIKSSLNIESIRVTAANDIRNIDQQIKQLNALSEKPEALMYQGMMIPEMVSQSLPQELDAIDTKLALLQSKYTDNDYSIRRVKETRRVLIDVLKRQTLGYLNAKRTDANSRLIASKRPKGVLIKYRELLREAQRDEGTLNALEMNRQNLALEQARKQNPWQLISTPTVLDFPVAPRKKRIVALGLLAGLVLGSGAALVVDRRTGLLWSLDELQRFLPYSLLTQLSAENETLWNASLTLISQSVLHDKSSIALLVVDPKSLNRAMGIAQALNQHANRDVVYVAEHPLAAAESDGQIVLAELGNVRREQVGNLHQQLQLQGKPVLGMIVLDAKTKAVIEKEITNA